MQWECLVDWALIFCTGMTECAVVVFFCIVYDEPIRNASELLLH